MNCARCTRPMEAGRINPLCSICQLLWADDFCRTLTVRLSIENCLPADERRAACVIADELRAEIASAERPKASAVTGEIYDVAGSMGAREVR